MDSSSTLVRAAKKEDCAEIIRLIQELADYEKMPDGPKIDEKVLEEDGFGKKSFFQCFVADDPSTENRLVGYVLFFFTYSTWEGRSVYMEDIYVSPENRGKGIGKTLWKACVQAGLEVNCSRCNFSVLNWNQSSIDFYESRDATNLTKSEGWHAFRMNKDQMKKFAEE